MSWFYLFMASMFEAGWIFSLKKIDNVDFKKISFTTESLLQIALGLWPFAGYVIFGLANIYFFSLSMKSIPASTAFAIWMGLTLVIVKLIEGLFFHQGFRSSDFFWLLLIVIGSIGLKYGVK